MRTKEGYIDTVSLVAIYICLCLPFFWIVYVNLFGVGNVFVGKNFAFGVEQGVLTPLGLVVSWGIVIVCLVTILYRSKKLD